MSPVLCAICSEQIENNNVIVTDAGLVHPTCYIEENE